MNIIEKILKNHSVENIKEVSPGDIVTVNVDKIIITDMAALHNEFINNPPLKPFDNNKIAIIFDHFVPPPNIEISNRINKLRKLKYLWDIKDFYDSGRGGISHVIAAEKGFLKPGNLIANTDSHTIAVGAFNSIGRGLGTPEIMNIIATGKTWFLAGNTIKINLNGNMNNNVSSKDIFFNIAKATGDIPNNNIEFSGDGIKSLTMDDRSSISTMCAELSAEFAVFPFDNVLKDYMDSIGINDYKPVFPGNDKYYKTYDIDLNKIEPMVALPDKIINNVKNISEINKTEINVAIVGSCANGRLSDLKDISIILKNHKVNENVRFIVTPASQEIYNEALRSGYIDNIIKANALVTNPTCGACLGGHMGVAGDNDVIISSTTRNFKGRMGSNKAKIYLASAKTVAISAINGYISGDLNE